MLFNSYEFIFIFLPVTIILYFIFAKSNHKFATLVLVMASILFYSYWSFQYLALLISSILFNYLLGKKIERNDSYKRFYLITGIIINLSLLCYYKYINFFIESLNVLVGTTLPFVEITLPLGISFYTFTQLAYLVDAYRGETKGYSFLSYSLFATFFPHLIAGPILYHKDIIPQFIRDSSFSFSHKNMCHGIIIFTFGLFKKVLIADSLVIWVKPIFDTQVNPTFFEAWVAAIAYTFQLYFDFSGYSDMAIGLGLMCNIVLPINFNSPYKALSIIDFWRRWHMTLSAFLKNYLYIPLGGNRCSPFRRQLNLMTTMLLGGLWHGAGWTFVIWGGLHGLYLIINHSWRKFCIRLPNTICWIFTFLSIVIAWVFFRAHSVNNALNILYAMAGLNGFNINNSFSIMSFQFFGFQLTELFNIHISAKKQIALTFGILISTILFLPNSYQLMQKLRPTKITAIILAAITILCLSQMNRVSEFLYFQF